MNEPQKTFKWPRKIKVSSTSSKFRLCASLKTLVPKIFFPNNFEICAKFRGVQSKPGWRYGLRPPENSYKSLPRLKHFVFMISASCMGGTFQYLLFHLCVEPQRFLIMGLILTDRYRFLSSFSALISLFWFCLPAYAACFPIKSLRDETRGSHLLNEKWNGTLIVYYSTDDGNQCIIFLRLFWTNSRSLE